MLALVRCIRLGTGHGHFSARFFEPEFWIPEFQILVDLAGEH